MVIEKNRYLIKAKILVGSFFGANPEDVFIELREPATMEYYDLQKVKKESGSTEMEALIRLLPSLICAHNFNKDEKSLYSPAEVSEIILSKIELFNFVINEYYEKVLFILMPGTGGQGKTKEEEKKID